MKHILKPGSIAFGFGLILTTLGQAQQGTPSGTPLSFKVPPNALSAISFSTAPNVQCSVAPANGSGSGQAFTVYTNDEGTATFYVTPSQESSSAAQLVATCSSGNQQAIEIQTVAGAKPLVAPAPPDPATNARLGHTVRPALTGDPMALSNQELVRLKYPLRPDPQKAPGAYASWLQAVSKPATFIPPKTVNVEGRPQGPAQIYAGANTQSARLATSDGTTGQFYVLSPNESGYILDQPTSPFDWIQGEWNVPAIVGGEEGTWTFADLRIGLDGPTLSAGTRQIGLNYNGFTYGYYYPWTQSSQGLMAISNFIVHPGDDIYSEVWVTDVEGNFNPYGGYSNFYFIDLTTGQSTYFVEPITPGTFAGQSAEWVIARISDSSCGGVCDLSDYSFAVMKQPLARTGDGNYANYQGGVSVGRSGQAVLYVAGNIFSFHLLSAVYPIDSNTMEFIWSNFH